METSEHSPPLTTMKKEPFYVAPPPVNISLPETDLFPLSVFEMELLPFFV